jgi:hypothetical protein
VGEQPAAHAGEGPSDGPGEEGHTATLGRLRDACVALSTGPAQSAEDAAALEVVDPPDDEEDDEEDDDEDDEDESEPLEAGVLLEEELRLSVR